HWLRFRINNDIHVARFEPSTTAEETERKPSRKFEAIDQDVTTHGKKLFDPLLGCRSMRNTREISKRPFVVTIPSFSTPCATVGVIGSRPTCFHENRK